MEPVSDSLKYYINAILIIFLVDINARDNNGRTLLWSAIKKRDPEFVKVVLERGAHIDNIGGPSGEPTNAFQVRHH